MSRGAAKLLRKNMTDAERPRWYRLRAHRFDGLKFKRQVPIGPYVVVFACMHRKLIIELDGGQHAAHGSDRERDDFLKARGFQVMRFWNNDALRDTDVVLGEILHAVGKLH